MLNSDYITMLMSDRHRKLLTIYTSNCPFTILKKRLMRLWASNAGRSAAISYSIQPND